MTRPIHPALNPDNITPACAGVPTEIFFPEKGESRTDTFELVKRTCAGCELREMCLEWALHYEWEGWWAGVSAMDRKLMRAKRGISYRAPEVDVLGHVWSSK